MLESERQLGIAAARKETWLAAVFSVLLCLASVLLVVLARERGIRVILGMFSFAVVSAVRAYASWRRWRFLRAADPAAAFDELQGPDLPEPVELTEARKRLRAIVNVVSLVVAVVVAFLVWYFR